MVYLSELRYHKNYPVHRRPLQTFATKRRNPLRETLLPYIRDCCEESSIHCVHYLTDPRMQKFEKFIWLLIIMATSFCATYVYYQLSDLYFTQRIQTTVKDSVHPVFFIPFPSIGICVRNRVNWPKLQDAHKIFLKPDASTEMVGVFQRFFERLEDFRFGAFEKLDMIFENKTIAKRISLINDVNIPEVMEYLTFNCTEVFEGNCYWRKKPYNCCDLFTLERTELGYCHVFNSLVSPMVQERAARDKFYPYHNAKSGESSGLRVDLKLDRTKMRPQFNAINGAYVMIKQPEQWSNDVRFINHNTYTKIGIVAQLTETDRRTRTVSPDERQCFFEDENDHPMYKKIPGLLYWRGNCITRCHQEYLVKYCNCSISLLFPNVKSDMFNECKPSDFRCMYEHEQIFSTDRHVFEREYLDDVGDDNMICNCMNSCNQLFFINYYTSVPLEGVNTADNMQGIHLDIHFQTPYIIKYSTRMRFTFVELLANFGGIIGLFLGASLLSAVELGYFLTIGLYSHLRKGRKTTNAIQVKSANMTKAFMATQNVEVRKY